MYQIKFRLRGIAPLLMNGWSPAALDLLRKNKTGGKKSEQEREEEAHEKVYRGPDGTLCIPADNLEVCLTKGARKAGLKRGRASLAPFIEATVLCNQRHLSLGIEQVDGIHEVHGKRPPKTGGACLIRRPFIKEGWSVSGEFTVADDSIDFDQVHEALVAAGMVEGLCDWRPKYGRFSVEEFEKIG